MRWHCLLLAATVVSAPAAAFDLQAHRGGRALSPENTLPAFRRAVALGVTTLELDAAITKDGVVVVSHDPRVNRDLARGPDGRWLAAEGPPIHELTVAELARYDVGRIDPGRPYAKQFPQQEAVDGTPIPRLADVFAVAASDPAIRFNIETKVTPTAPEETLEPAAFARKVVAEVRRAGVALRTTIQSFDWRTLQVVQKEAPEIATVYLTARRGFLDNVCGGPAGRVVAPADCEPSAWTAGFQLREHGSVPRMVKAAGGSAWSPFWADVDAAAIAEAHALGLRVVPWTVNDPPVMERLVDAGVDGLITDRPDLLKALLEKRRIAFR